MYEHIYRHMPKKRAESKRCMLQFFQIWLKPDGSRRVNDKAQRFVTDNKGETYKMDFVCYIFVCKHTYRELKLMFALIGQNPVSASASALCPWQKITCCSERLWCSTSSVIMQRNAISSRIFSQQLLAEN